MEGNPAASVAYIGLGANRGDRIDSLRQAIQKLQGKNILITKVSSLYETEPMEFKEQAFFLNAVIEIETLLSPRSLLECCQSIERELGKKTVIPKGPRTIDLDLLFYGQLIVDEPELTIPHPAAATRPFVLIPLVEVAPGFIHPRLHQTGRALLDRLKSQPAVEKRSGPGWEIARNLPSI